MKKSRTRMSAWAIVAIAVFTPLLLALLATWHWKPAAFILTFLLIAGGAGLAFQLLTKKKITGTAYQSAAGLAIATVLVLMWMNAAVGGILGDNPANMMYFGVLLVGLTGAAIARLEPVGMSHALFAVAFAVLLVPAIALAVGTPAFANGVVAVFGLHTLFAMLFAGSALLFRRAAFRRAALRRAAFRRAEPRRATNG